MKITHLRIKSYRGIAALDVDIPPAGAIVKGQNAKGKTSVLRAIRAALAAQDIAPDAIRLGEDKAEIVVDLDDHTVRRAITAKGSTLTVEKGGMKASKPTTYLTDLLGTSPLDPLDLFLAKPKDRKAQILAALPITVTREQIAKYAPELPLDFSTDGHGLEVVERARKHFYDERTLANKEAAEAKREAARLAEEARKIAATVTPGPLVPDAEARAAVVAAEREVIALESRTREAAESEARTASTRDRIAQLEAEAAKIEATIAEVNPQEVLDARAEHAEWDAKVRELEAALEQARLCRIEAGERVARFDRVLAESKASSDRAASLREQAKTLAGALAAATVAAPAEIEIATAKAKLDAARATLERAALQAQALAAAEKAEQAKRFAEDAAKDADELDATVKRLANDAPTELLTAAAAIPGLSIEGDEVLLDGKRLDALSGAEQMRLAVEIARRANARSRILVVDGLERLDPEQMDAFVRMATRDGWQLLGTRVDRGDIELVAIEPEEAAAAAE